MPVIAFPTGILTGAVLFLLRTGASVASLRPATGAFAIAWLSAIILGFIELAVDIFYLLSLAAAKDRLRA